MTTPKYMIALIILPALLACNAGEDLPEDGLPEVESGTLMICASDNISHSDDLDLEISGTVTAIDDGAVDCARSVTVMDMDGELSSFGYSLSDAMDSDVSPALDISAGDTIDVRYRYRIVFGDVRGLLIEDVDGLVMAADEGTWGGAFNGAEINLFEVSRGEEVVAKTPTGCEPRLGHELTFESDALVTLTPFSSAPFAVDGVAMTAFAVTATTWGDSTNCQSSDSTDHATWMLSR